MIPVPEVVASLVERGDGFGAAHANPRALTAFMFFQVFGLVGMSILLLTAVLSSRVTARSPVWLNFVISWILSTAAYMMLIGKDLSYVPDRRLCFAQAVLVYTMPTFTAGTTLALVVNVLITVKAVLKPYTQRDDAEIRLIWTVLLIICPYIPTFAMGLVSLMTGLNDPASIKRNRDGMYCNMNNKLPSKLSAIVVSILMVVCLGLEIVIVRAFYGNWHRLKNHPRSIAMGMRVVVFSFFGVLSIALSMVFFFTTARSPIFNIIIGTVPVAAVVVFGTQRDLINAWLHLFRKLLCLDRGHRYESESSLPPGWSSASRSGGLTTTQYPDTLTFSSPIPPATLTFHQNHKEFPTSNTPTLTNSYRKERNSGDYIHNDNLTSMPPPHRRSGSSYRDRKDSYGTYQSKSSMYTVVESIAPPVPSKDFFYIGPTHHKDDSTSKPPSVEMGVAL